MRKSDLQHITNRTLQGLLVIGAFLLTAVSCNDVNLTDAPGGKAHMKVHLTDAPADYQEVNVDVQGLRIHFTPTGSDTASVDTTKDGKWIDLPVDPVVINLLELTNGVDSLLASADLEPGHYKELRLILGDENTVVIDGVSHDLKVPSGQQSGYKIKFKTELQAGEELDVVIDFDAGRSVHKAGKSGKYILRPVLKAFVDGNTGSIGGTVEPTDANASVFAILDDDTSSTTPDGDGNFLIQGLKAGQYDLSIKPANEQYSDTTLTDITVEKGKETDVGIITLSGS